MFQLNILDKILEEEPFVNDRREDFGCSSFEGGFGSLDGNLGLHSTEKKKKVSHYLNEVM